MPYLNKYLTLSITVVLLIASNLSAQLSSDQIDELVTTCLEKFEVAGIAVGIVKDGKIIHTKGYGVKSVDTKELVDEHTNFAIASNSKAFTTAALSILVDEGKISWQDKVIDHIPEFKMYNAYVTENFMIEDLLTHRSGLGLGIGDLMFFPDGADFTIEDVLVSFQHFKPQSAFRTKFDYDNLLYFVAGEVIARVSGMSWEDFVEQRIFAPLNMDHSFSALSEDQHSSNLATPHSTEKGPIRTINHFDEMVNGAAGGIFSNVDDICNWMLVQLNHGKYGDSLDNVLFTEERQHEMWSIHTLLDVNRNPRYNSHFAGYGLGWGVTDLLGNMSVSHTGGLPGMLSRTVLIPDLDLGVIVLTNTESGGGSAFGVISRTIVDSYLGLDDYEWTDKYLEYYTSRKASGDEVTSAVWKTVEEANDDHINPEDFVGIYIDSWFGKVEVFLQNEQLWIKAHRSPKLNGPLAFYKANTFAIKWDYQDMNADAFAMFSLDENGKAQSIKMKGISPNIDFSFDFQDLDLQRVDD